MASSLAEVSNVGTGWIESIRKSFPLDDENLERLKKLVTDLFRNSGISELQVGPGVIVQFNVGDTHSFVAIKTKDGWGFQCTESMKAGEHNGVYVDRSLNIVELSLSGPPGKFFPAFRSFLRFLARGCRLSMREPALGTGCPKGGSNNRIINQQWVESFMFFADSDPASVAEQKVRINSIFKQSGLMDGFSVTPLLWCKGPYGCYKTNRGFAFLTHDDAKARRHTGVYVDQDAGEVKLSVSGVPAEFYSSLKEFLLFLCTAPYRGGPGYFHH